MNWINFGGGQGTSVKIARDASFRNGMLQFEYTIPNDGIYWDLSDLDGHTAGMTGSPFFHDNVKVSPTGAGRGQGTCLQIRCPAGKVCHDAYQRPNDVKTRFCPKNTGDMWIDLCQPTPQFLG